MRSMLDRLPVWAQVVAMVGLPSVIAYTVTVFLMSMFSHGLAQAAVNTTIALKNHEVLLKGEQDIQKRLDGLHDADALIVHYLRAMCLNQATTPVQVARCQETK